VSDSTVAIFESIPGKTVSRIRHAASGYDTAGDWIVGGETPTNIDVIVHPITGKTSLSERMIREIGNNRDRKWVVIYSPPLDSLDTIAWRTSSEAGQYEADIMVYKSDRYEIMMVDDWEAGVLDHIKAIAVKQDLRDVD